MNLFSNKDYAKIPWLKYFFFLNPKSFHVFIQEFTFKSIQLHCFIAFASASFDFIFIFMNGYKSEYIQIHNPIQLYYFQWFNLVEGMEMSNWKKKKFFHSWEELLTNWKQTWKEKKALNAIYKMWIYCRFRLATFHIHMKINLITISQFQ